MKYCILILTLSLFSCHSTKSIYVSENLSEQNTLLVRENSNDEWVQLADGIEGFEHKTGVLQKIEVTVDAENNYKFQKVLFQEIKENKTTEPKGNWTVTHITNLESLSTQPTMKLGSGKMYGKAGCNKFSADYSINNSEMTISESIATKMYCPNMPVEKAFFECLRATKSFKMESDELMLLDENNAILLTCKKDS